MAITNRDRVNRAVDLLAEGLAPFVVRELKNRYGVDWFTVAVGELNDDQKANIGSPEAPKFDTACVLVLIWKLWNEVFRQTFGNSERNLVSELREVRRKAAHQEAFATDDAYRALDSAARLLTAVSAKEAEEVERMKQDLMRLKYEEQVRSEKRRTASSAIESAAANTLRPWREVAMPHADVRSGNYQNAQFAADLWYVHLGKATSDYQDPEEFFRRTFLTESLTKLLVNALRRVEKGEGDPVVQLRTNFGGGKTHSMLALLHLFRAKDPGKLLGIDDVLRGAEVTKVPAAKPVVLVGNRISPSGDLKPDGTQVNTLWGELAYQLGGLEAYEMVRRDDENGTNPGDRLRELLDLFGPAVVLVDEWVAYARQLHDESDLPGGTFDTQFTFAQTLTECVKVSKGSVLLVSLPASDGTGSSSGTDEGIEVGGARGRQALERLEKIVGRLEASWRPATAEEGYEIVRRRLFEQLSGPDAFKVRDFVARSFSEMYRAQPDEFPSECREADYEKLMQQAYPIHPEVFERLYADWSAIPKFQRTRGVLRLMAAVIHRLWADNDKNALIMPCHVGLDNMRIREELVQYLSDPWEPILEKDVDGRDALPQKLDRENSGFGRFHASRRVARTIFMGSAPKVGVANQGLSDQRIKLGSVAPGESAAVFGDALRRLATAATYLYHEGQRYWYSTAPTVAKLAQDKAEMLRREPEKVAEVIRKRVTANVTSARGDFQRVHPFPASCADVLDERSARLVVLGPDAEHSKDNGAKSIERAKELLASRGAGPRLYQNTLAFLAPDKQKLEDLEDAARWWLAWTHIVEDNDLMAGLSGNQQNQAKGMQAQASSVVDSRIPETFFWLIYPSQELRKPTIEWRTIRLSGNESLAVRASARLKRDELLIGVLAPTRLRMEIDRVPLWEGADGAHVSVRTLIDHFAKFMYLPRVVGEHVLMKAVFDGLAVLSWGDTFAYADAYDEAAKRYVGLRAGFQMTGFNEVPPGVLVRPTEAQAQLAVEAAARRQTDDVEAGVATIAPPASGSDVTPSDVESPEPTTPKRFYGSVDLSPERVGRDASMIAEEVICHLTALLGAEVRVTLQVEARVSEGIDDRVVRVVRQNTKDLRFQQAEFETED